MDKARRFSGIETLRFLCAVAVVFWHYQHFYMGVPEGSAEAFSHQRQPLWWLFRAFYDYGYLSVWFFWMISGFVFFWKYHEPIAAGAVHGRTFFVLRFSRLYPLHLATLLFVAALQPVYAIGHGGEPFVFGNNDLYHFALNLGFASNWGFETGYSFNGPIWSVSAEVLVYALFFAVSMVGSRGLWGRIGLLLATVVVWAAVTRIPAIYGLRVALACAAFFFTGGVVHAIVGRLTHRAVGLLAPLAIAAALVFAWFTFDGGFRFLVFVDHRGEASVPKWAIYVVGVLLVFGFVGLEGRGIAGRIFERLAPLADTTYSSYLVHFPIQLVAVIVIDHFGWSRALFDRPVALVAYLVLVFGSAWIVFHRFERPAQDRLRRILFTKRPAPPVDGLPARPSHVG